jgi:hypothetical protein
MANNTLTIFASWLTNVLKNQKAHKTHHFSVIELMGSIEPNVIDSIETFTIPAFW